MSAMFDGPDMFDPAIFDTKGQFTISLVEPPVTIGDSVAASAQFKRNIIDAGGSMFDGPDMFDPAIFDTTLKTILITDSITAILQKGVSLTEPAISITEDIVSKLSSFRVIAEPTLAITEDIVRKLTAFRVFTEPILAITDSVVVVRTTLRGIVEAAISITDDVVRKLTAFRVFIENITISEVLTILQDRQSTKTDTSNLCLRTDDESDLCM